MVAALVGGEAVVAAGLAGGGSCWWATSGATGRRRAGSRTAVEARGPSQVPRRPPRRATTMAFEVRTGTGLR